MYAESSSGQKPQNDGPLLPPVQEPCGINTNYILYWNHAGLELNGLTHSETIHGPQSGPPISARALGILHLAIHDAYFSIHPPLPDTFELFFTLDTAGTDGYVARQAVAGAAITVLEMLYARPFPNFGVRVGNIAFESLNYEPIDRKYTPKSGHYLFNDDPTNPVGKGYHEPFYGRFAKRFATQVDHVIADPPPIRSAEGQTAEYDDSIRDVYRMGGSSTLNSTTRSPIQSAKAHFWAYDGANLIGTPPRLYNQILRIIAFDRKCGTDITDEANNRDFARLFALVNATMADAGIFAWREKYEFEFWRPLSGVRQDGRDAHGDPFWLSVGAPATNSNGLSFKPPFPAYPSGHATFVAAAFQIARLFYAARDSAPWGPTDPDTICFTFVSDEMNGVSRDLYQAYDPRAAIDEQSGNVRTKIVREFHSLWEAILENALSRIWLGVHWRFDACAAKDILLPTAKDDVYEPDATKATVYQNVEDIRYTTLGTRQSPCKTSTLPGLFPIGGVPLGLNIANDIFSSGLKPSPCLP